MRAAILTQTTRISHPLLRPVTLQSRLLHAVREFPPQIAHDLLTNGYAIFDQALTPTTTAALRAEIDTLASDGHLGLNTTHIVRKGSPALTFPKRHVYEAELNLLPSDTFEELPALNALRDETTICTLLSVFAPRMTLHSHAIKVQRSDGLSACFPVHLDSTPTQDDRMVTALLYLTPEWQKTHGGCLRIYESPLNFSDIHPIEGRLVLLASTGMHHRVLPAHKHRYVITVWCSGSIRPCPRPLFSNEKVSHQVALLLLQPRYRDMAFRLVLEAEWEQSLWDAHEAHVAAQAVAIHRQNLQLIRARLPKVLCKELNYPQEVDRIAQLLQSPKSLMQAFRELDREDPALLSFRW